MPATTAFKRKTAARATNRMSPLTPAPKHTRRKETGAISATRAMKRGPTAGGWAASAIRERFASIRRAATSANIARSETAMTRSVDVNAVRHFATRPRALPADAMGSTTSITACARRTASLRRSPANAMSPRCAVGRNSLPAPAMRIARSSCRAAPSVRSTPLVFAGSSPRMRVGRAGWRSMVTLPGPPGGPCVSTCSAIRAERPFARNRAAAPDVAMLYDCTPIEAT